VEVPCRSASHDAGKQTPFDHSGFSCRNVDHGFLCEVRSNSRWCRIRAGVQCESSQFYFGGHAASVLSSISCGSGRILKWSRHNVTLVAAQCRVRILVPSNGALERLFRRGRQPISSVWRVPNRATMYDPIQLSRAVSRKPKVVPEIKSAAIDSPSLSWNRLHVP